MAEKSYFRRRTTEMDEPIKTILDVFKQERLSAYPRDVIDL